MFLSEWREFPSKPCLAGKKKLDDSSRLNVVEIARVPDMLPSLIDQEALIRFFLKSLAVNIFVNDTGANCKHLWISIAQDIKFDTRQ